MAEDQQPEEPRAARPVPCGRCTPPHAKEVRPTEAVFSREAAACTHAAAMSKDSDVLAASVVRFTVDELGVRCGVAMYVAGKCQRVPYVSDCRAIHAGGRK